MNNKLIAALLMTLTGTTLWAESRTVDAFTAIAYPLSYDVEFVAGSEHRVDFEGDQDTIDEIETRVSDNTLRLSKDSGWFDWSDGDVSITITYVALEGITLSGSGEGFAEAIDADRFDLKITGSAGFEAEQVNCNDLTLRVSGSGNIDMYNLRVDNVSASISGSGDMELTGETISQTVTITGSGDYSAKDLRSQEATVKVTGSGDAQLWAQATLDARVIGSGDITYYGNPSENTSVTGSGNIEQRDRK
ncbi:MAG: head GIN domain-containing protein [bacterium]